MKYALELENVSKKFGDLVAVDQLTICLEAGSFIGLLGRNGAGKTTTINMATGLMRPTSGRILVLGENIQDQPVQIKRRIGVMPQDDSLLDWLTADQYLDFVGRIYGLSKEVIRQRRSEMFQLLELTPQPQALVRDFSYGMKKKVALSAALLHGPEILFLDEPFEGIDPVTSRTIKDILLSLGKKGVTILMSSHVLDVVERLCPLIAIIDRGKLMGIGSIDELRSGHASDTSLEELFISLMGGAKRGDLSWI